MAPVRKRQCGMLNKMARILVAEDDDSMREFLSEALDRNDHDVTAVRNGKEAMARIGDDEFDLLLADVDIPGLDGISLARRARDGQSDLPVLFVTGYANKVIIEDGLLSEDVRVLSKPFGLQDLIRTVKRMLPANRA